MEEFLGVAGAQLQLNHPVQGRGRRAAGRAGRPCAGAGRFQLLGAARQGRQAAPAGHLGRAAHAGIQGRADAARRRLRRGGDAPNGVGAPKGLDPAVAQRLREAFKAAAASPEFKKACAKIDAPLMYLDGPDYEKYVQAVYRKETALIERLKLRELLKMLMPMSPCSACTPTTTCWSRASPSRWARRCPSSACARARRCPPATRSRRARSRRASRCASTTP
jgi:hypothetical protein